MAFVDLPNYLYYPQGAATTTTPTSDRNSVMDADGEKVAFILKAPRAGTINNIAFNMTAFTQCTNGLKVSIQGVGTNEPDGTPTHYRVVPNTDMGADTTIVTGLMTDDGTDTGNKKTLTAGEVFAVVIEFNSFAASDSLSIMWCQDQGQFNGRTHASYALLDVGAGYVRQTITQTLQIGVKLATVGYMKLDGCRVHDGTMTNGLSVNSGTAADEIALKFTLPVPMRCIGMRWYGTLQNAGAAGPAHTVRLYDASDTVLGSAVETELFACSTDNGAGPKGSYWSGGGVELEANTTYRVAIEGTASDSGIVVYYNQISAVDSDLTAVWPWGADGVYSSRADGGAWTDVTTKQPEFFLIVDAIDPVKTSVLSAVQKFFAPVFNRRHR